MPNEEFQIGLDIGANSVKAVILNKTKSGFILEEARLSKLSYAAVENGVIMDFGELVHGIIDVMRNDIFGTNKVNIALKGPSVVVRRVSVYTDNREELKENFLWVVNQYGDIDPEEMSIDFEILGGAETFNSADILFTAAKKDIIIDFVSVLESSSVRPVAIEAEALSLVRLYRGLDYPKNDTTMIIHAGYVGSLIIFIKDGKFNFCREIPCGGKNVTDIIKHDLGVNDQEAERIKMDPNIHSDPKAVTDIINRIISIEFILATDSVYKFYTLKNGKPPERIFLSGGAGETYGLKEALSAKYSVMVDYLNPWKSIEVSKEYTDFFNTDNRLSYNVALGLAMHRKIF